MLDRVATNWSVAVTPIIESILDNNFTFVPSTIEATQIGRFHLNNLIFDWMPVSQSEWNRRVSKTDPFRYGEGKMFFYSWC
jgi:hypothetical protein